MDLIQEQISSVRFLQKPVPVPVSSRKAALFISQQDSGKEFRIIGVIRAVEHHKGRAGGNGLLFQGIFIYQAGYKTFSHPAFAGQKHGKAVRRIIHCSHTHLHGLSLTPCVSHHG